MSKTIRVLAAAAILVLAACGPIVIKPASGPHGGARCMPSCDLPIRR